MGFNARTFDVYVVVGGPSGSPAWTRATWLALAPHLDVLFADKTTAVRTFQIEQVGNRLKYARFGRIGWNAASHAKWTDPIAQFTSTEVWRPSWGACEKRANAPDAFLKVHGCPSHLAGSSVLRLAVATDRPHRDHALAAMRGVAATLDARLSARLRDRPWALPFAPAPAIAVTASIMDASFIVPTHRDDGDPKLPLAVLEGSGWEAI